MDLDMAIKQRRSIRKFKKRKVGRKLIGKIIEAGTYAPSACNMQMWHFVVISDEKIKNKLCSIAGSPNLVRNSSFTIFVLYDKGTTKQNFANIQSTAAAIQNMLLNAYSMGIGSVWMAACGDRKKIREMLKIPENFIIVAGISFGYPDETPKTPVRRKDVISFNLFGKTTTYPASFNPDDWTIEKIRDYQSFKIRAKSPSSFLHRPELKGELKGVVESIDTLEGKTLDMFPYFANHTFSLLMENKIRDLTICEMSKEVIGFLKWKFNPLKKKITFKKELDNFSMNSASFDSVTCFNSLNRIPNPGKIVKEAHRVLKKGGTLYLFFTNRTSIYGVIYKLYGIVKKTPILLFLSKKMLYPFYSRNSYFKESVIVPFRPLSYGYIKRLLRNFRVETLIGSRFSKTVLLKAVKK